MRRLLVSAVLVLAALILQLCLLDRLPLPGGVAPDLVLHGSSDAARLQSMHVWLGITIWDQSIDTSVRRRT